MKKRLFSLCSLLLIACIACFGFAACGDDEDSEWKDSPLIGNWGYSNHYYSITYNKKTGKLSSTHYQHNNTNGNTDKLTTVTVSKNSDDTYNIGYSNPVTYNAKLDRLNNDFVRTTKTAEEWFAENT